MERDPKGRGKRKQTCSHPEVMMMTTTKASGRSSISTSSTSVSSSRSTSNTSSTGSAGSSTRNKGASAAKAIQAAGALKSVSDRQLLSSIRKLSNRERETVFSILVHLIEIDRRDLYLPLGFASLYEFCIKHLGYCEATAARRVNVARCIGRFPAACRALASGKVNLTNLSLVTKLMTRENAGDLLSRISGASKKEVELLVSSRNPGSAIRETVRPVHVRTVIEVPVSGDGKEFTITGDGKNSTTSGAAGLKGSGPDAALDSGRRPALAESSATTESPAATGHHATAERQVVTERRVVLEERLKITFGADHEFMSKVDRTRALLSTKYHRHLGMDEVFSILMDEYIERRSPEGRIRRKEKREQRKAAQKTRKASGTAVAVKGNGSGKKENSEDSRYIPQKVRDEIHARDKGRCSYVSPGGRRCGATHDLQIDHIVPFARGGGNSPSNLRLLCAKHNRLEAERVYGKEKMENHTKKDMGRYVKEHGETYVKEHKGLYKWGLYHRTRSIFPVRNSEPAVTR